MNRYLWAFFSAGLALLALAAQSLPSAALDWQPERWTNEPWRLFSAALVHWSTLHLAANLAGCAVLALLGWTARLGRRDCAAWLLAWPLTQLGLLALPDLQHYGGLSGVLHAGVAVAVVELLARAGRERLIGAAIAAGLLLKLVLEQPLGGPSLRQVDGWDIAIVPFAHLSGAVAGALCALALRMRTGWRA